MNSIMEGIAESLLSLAKAEADSIKRTFDFKGRASRRQFMYVLFIDMLILAGLQNIEYKVFNTFGMMGDSGVPYLIIIMCMWLALQVLFLIKSLSISVRRVHDYGESAKKLLLVILAVAVLDSISVGYTVMSLLNGTEIDMTIQYLTIVPVWVLSAVYICMMMLKGSSPSNQWGEPTNGSMVGNSKLDKETDGGILKMSNFEPVGPFLK